MKGEKNGIPSWNLSDLFSSIGDPAIGKSHEKTLAKAREFRKRYMGRLKAISRDGTLVEALALYEEIISETAKMGCYAYLEFSVNAEDPSRGAFLQKIKRQNSEIHQEVVFFELEIIGLPKSFFAEIPKDGELSKYAHFFEKLAERKNHVLSEEGERVAQIKSLTGRGAFERLFEQELAAQKFMVTKDGKKEELSQAQILDILHSGKTQSERKKAAKIFTLGLEEKASLLSYTFNILAEDKFLDDRMRNFTYAQQARHLDNEVSAQAVKTLTDVVRENYGLVQRYYRFKRKTMGLGKLYDFDRYAPLPDVSQRIPFSAARDMVLSSYYDFSENFGKSAEDFFTNDWIDASPKKGKQGGAYCMYVTPNLHPYIMMNYTESPNDAKTLAHELGHGIHGRLAARNSILNFDWPLTMSETASIFGESLLFPTLLDSVKNREAKLSMVMERIEGIIASVFRQIAMYCFESDLHELYRKKGELSREEIGSLWRARQVEMFGDSVILTPDYDKWWAYISHFVHTPFYVYAYAFGELLTLSLYERYARGEEGFVANYTELLSRGGSASPAELLSSLGIDMEDRKLWEEGMELIEKYLTMAQSLSGR